MNPVCKPEIFCLSTFLNPSDLPVWVCMWRRAFCFHGCCRGEHTPLRWIHCIISCNRRRFGVEWMQEKIFERLFMATGTASIYSICCACTSAAVKLDWLLCARGDVRVQRKWRNTARLWCVEKPTGAASGGLRRRGISKNPFKHCHDLAKQTQSSLAPWDQERNCSASLAPPRPGSFFAKRCLECLIFSGVVSQMYSNSEICARRSRAPVWPAGCFTCLLEFFFICEGKGPSSKPLRSGKNICVTEISL